MFTLDTTPGAYRWWYFDAISDDREWSMVAIFFVGSVFSPAYARRWAEGASPLPREHVAVNFAIARRGRPLVWVFSEYGADRLDLDVDTLRVKDSTMTREADRVHLRIDDVRVARGTPVKAKVEVRLVDPPVGDARGIALGSERHRWRCHAPRTRVDVSVESLGLAFSGSGYHDENWGDEPPVTSLRSWSWGRVHDGSRSRVFFDVVPHHGPRTHLVFDSRSGRHEEIRPPLTLRRSPFRWMLAEPKTMDAGPGDDGAPMIVRASRSLERAPFYHRFQAPFRFARRAPPVTGVAEHVDFVRFARPVVRGMIGYRLAEPDRGWFGKIP